MTQIIKRLLAICSTCTLWFKGNEGIETVSCLTTPVKKNKANKKIPWASWKTKVNKIGDCRRGSKDTRGTFKLINQK